MWFHRYNTSRTETVEVRTSLGVIPLTGHFGDKVALLAINGAFIAANSLARLPTLLAADAECVVAQLPGEHAPALAETSLAAFARAFDEVVETLGPSVVMGHSVGGLVALAMRSPSVRAVVALDPPLLPAKMWPVIGALRGDLVGPRRDFIEALFGVSAEGIEPRDYRPLLDGLCRPTTVVVGSDPLMPPRAFERAPSFVDEPERALFAAHPMITLRVAPNSGHMLHNHASDWLVDLLRQTCREHAV